MFDLSGIKKACANKGITIAELERETGIGNGVISRWQSAKGSPQIHSLVLIANALDAPFELIAFSKEKTAPTSEDGFSNKEKEFIRLFRQLPTEKQNLIIQQAQGLILLQTIRGVGEE